MTIKAACAHSPLVQSKMAAPQIVAHNRKFKLAVAEVAQKMLPKTWFCWFSRGNMQLRAWLRPRKWAYCTKISQGIYLGAIPLKNRNHIKKITKLGVTTILSINEDYECKNQLFARPVKPKEWEKRNIKVLRINSPDLKPIEISKMLTAVNYVVEQVKLGNCIYVHCTAGRGRSASVVICALTQIKNCSLDEAIQYVKHRRSMVSLTQKQMQAIQICYQTLANKKLSQ